MLKITRVVALGTAAGLLFGLAAFAFATAPSGQHVSTPVVGTLPPIDIEANDIELETNKPAEVATVTLTLDPGGFTGWHTHPGILIATVQSGAVVRQVGCHSRTYGVGQVFVEHGDQPTGQVRNASATEPAVFSVTQIAPADVPRRAESAAPNCGRSNAD